MPTNSDAPYKLEQRRHEELASRPLHVEPSDVEFVWVEDIRQFITLNRAMRRTKFGKEVLRRYRGQR